MLVNPSLQSCKTALFVSTPLAPHQNALLAALPREGYAQLLPGLEPVVFALGDIVYEPGGHLNYVYFPTSAIVSMVYTLENGATVEMGLVGKEGVVGIALFMGGETTPNRGIVQLAGEAYRLQAKRLKEEFKRAGALQLLLLRYTQALITQIAQTAVCNRLHPLEQRLCRRLLLCADRVSADELPMTQELVSHMLGAQRESVTVAAGHLQDQGLIRYARGHITLLNREGLEAAVCECYQVVSQEDDRLWGLARAP
jgi:CRP-like cAMP-binding protein